MADELDDAVNLALDFVEALTKREYDKAFLLTAANFVEEGGEPLSVDAMREKFELIVPADWVFVDMKAIYSVAPPPADLLPKYIRGPLAIMEAETDWVEEPDVAFMYVAIADEAEGEGLSVYVTREESALRIREITFGRP